MPFRWMRAFVLLALAPGAALAFETVDTLPFPSTGPFYAYPADAVQPWTIFAYGGAMYDTNAFRRPTGEQSDVVTRLGAGARATPRIIGRQRALLEAFGEYYDFDRFSQIDHFGYGLRSDLLWEIGNDINGAAGYTRRRRHADLGEFRAERKVMITTDRLLVDGGYRFHPDWRIFAGAEHNRAKRDTEDSARVESNTLRGSLTYRTPLGTAVGLAVRGTRGDTRIEDEVTGIDFRDEFDEREIALTLAYALGAQLRIGGRVGHTERTYDELEERNFNGATYRGVVDWVPTGKLTFSVEAYREPESVVDASASHVLRRGAGVGVRWAPTFKLVFTARLLSERRQYQGDAAAELLGVPFRDDTLRVWRFGAGWEPQRHWQLGAGLDLGDRTSNLLDREYDYAQVMLNLRWTY